MRHDDPTATVRWFEIDPCYVFHVGTAHEDDSGRIVLDGARYTAADMAAPWSGAGAGRPPERQARTRPARPPSSASPGCTAGRSTRPPATVAETPLHDRPVEFPTVDPARVGRAARYRYAVTSTDRANAIVRLDLDTGNATAHELGPDVKAGEAVFVPSPRPDRAEDEGWLLTITDAQPTAPRRGCSSSTRPTSPGRWPP